MEFMVKGYFFFEVFPFVKCKQVAVWLQVK